MLDDIKLMAQQQEGKYAYPLLWGMARSLLSDENIKTIHQILKEQEEINVQLHANGELDDAYRYNGNDYYHRQDVVKIKKIAAVLLTWYMAVVSLLSTPSEAYTVGVADLVKCDNEYATTKLWTKKLSKAYAKLQMAYHYPEWNLSEYKALLKLWGKESGWNHLADNPHSSAFGIPQMLNLHPKTPAPAQIEQGLAYIQHRYDKPSVAWAHWRKHNWYQGETNERTVR